MIRSQHEIEGVVHVCNVRRSCNERQAMTSTSTGEWVAETDEERAARIAREDEADRSFSSAVVELMREKVEDEHGDGINTPWLEKDARLDQPVIRRLKLELDANPALEIWVRSYPDSPKSSGPSSTRLRGYLGPDYYVRRESGNIFARRRKPDEPKLRNDRVLLGDEWLTPGKAAELIGVSETYVRRIWYDTPALPVFRFSRRAVVRRVDAERIAAERELGRSAGGRALVPPSNIGKYNRDEDVIGRTRTQEDPW